MKAFQTFIFRIATRLKQFSWSLSRLSHTAQDASTEDRDLLISLVVPTYNVSAYIDTFLQSIFAQSSWLYRFEVIIVDDGSTDRTAEIVRSWQSRHPKHIRYIYQNNAGLSAARNTGLAMAAGTWISFPDPDDFLHRHYFREILKEIQAAHHRPLVAIATNFIYYQEDRETFSDTHPLRFRFEKGVVRVTSGDMQDHILTSVNACLLHRPTLLANDLTFDNRVVPAFEDVHLTNRLLVACPDRTVSFLPEARYFYRKRSNKTSLLDGAQSKREWYLNQLEYGPLDLLTYAKRRLGKIPVHLQRTCLYEVMWRFRHLVNHAERTHFLTEADKARFLELVSRIMDFIQPEVIGNFHLAGCIEEHKVALLWLYKRRRRDRIAVYLQHQDKRTGMFQFAYHTGGDDTFALDTLVDGKSVEPACPSRISADFLGQTYFRRHYFWVPLKSGQSIKFSLSDRPAFIKLGGKALGEQLDQSTLCRVLRRKPPKTLDSATRRLRHHVISRRSFYSGCRVLMDRDDKADDNAEHLYRHMLNTGRADNAYFILRKTSPDWERLRAEGFSLLAFGSDEHIAAQLNAATVVSSHFDHFIFWPVPQQHFADLSSSDFVFLQHGVTVNNLSQRLNGKPIRLFVTAMTAEWASVASPSGPYIFSEREVLLSGFPRHDALLEMATHLDADSILFIPTWREYLTRYIVGRIGMQREKVTTFADSDYARHWRTLLCDARLQQMADERNLRIVFAPHPNMAMYIDDFRIPPQIEVVDVRQGHSYQDLFCRAKIAVTDYSSASTDVAFLQRPVIYYQFDAQRMFQGNHICKPGYFSYARDGFGAVVTTRDEVCEMLMAVLDGSENPIYAKRRKEAFVFRDGHCCERVCRAIEKLSEPQSADTLTYATESA